MKRLREFDPKTIIITPTRRLSAWLLAEYSQLRLMEKETSWETPRILPYEAWLNWHYQQAIDQGGCQKLLLTDNQSKLIWQSIIKTSSLADTVLQHQQTATLAGSAFSLSQQWLLPLDHPAFQDSIDYQAFQTLAKSYLEQLTAQHTIDSSQLYLELEEIIIQKTSAIAFLGFAEFTAEQQRLIHRLKSANKTVLIDNLHHVDDPDVERFTFKDLNTELKSMACYCKKTLEDHANQTIGCVIPKLTTFRDKVEAIFNRHIPGKFNISAAKPLSTYPIIYTALQCLTLNKIELNRELVSHLLRTPFIGSAETELSTRMQLDFFLARHNIQSLSLKFLRQISERSTPLFFELLTQLETITAKQSLSNWAKTFNQQLTALGWPGERTLNSIEFQTAQRFYKILDELSALELIQEACYFGEVFHILSQLCQHALFQSETDAQPIQILGSLEAAGLAFDRLWISGLNDADWPALHAPNPFIPLRLQREKSLPHSSAQHTLTFYQALCQQLFHASPQLILSYARQIEGIDYRASPLILAYPESTLDFTEAEPSKTPLSCEEYPTEGLPLQKLSIQGGTGYFKSQAACPFQAYALFRLKAHSIPEPYFGLDAKDRGIIAHKALELIWKTLQSSQQLNALKAPELQTLINNAVQQTLGNTKLSPSLRDLETTRLNSLLFDWLTLEKTREPFNIAAIEKSEQTSINGLEFIIRADRIDETTDGKQLVIDYKTKKVTVNDWLDERLIEPQLPIYALRDDRISNIAFAQVRRDELKFATLDDIDWPTQKEIWLQQLNSLADEIKLGVATVTPRNTLCCQQCDLHSLCRIHEVSHDE